MISDMQAAQRAEKISVEEYLELEKTNDIRHECVGGILYAMAGASDEHIAICVNLVSALRHHLKGTPCRVQISEGKVRLRAANEDIFYYPDLMLVCDPRDQDRYFKQYPKVLIEVLSESTETIDRREKFLSYRQIETLEEYVLVAQNTMEVTVFEWVNQWQPEISTKAHESLRLPVLKFSQLFREVYDGVNL